MNASPGSETKGSTSTGVALWVQHSDGTREDANEVTAQAAFAAFRAVDWGREFEGLPAASQPDEDGGEAVFYPEYGLVDDASRILRIYSEDGGTFAVAFEEPELTGAVWSLDTRQAILSRRALDLPRVVRCIEAYFCGHYQVLRHMLAQDSGES